MEIAIAGSTGLIGSELVRALRARGHKVRRLVRSENELGTDNILWSPRQGIQDLHRLEGIDAAVNLCGRSIASGRWTRARKAAIYSSRVDSTRMLVDRIGRLQKKPAVFLNASAVGYYGDRADAVLDESSGPGEGFLAELAQAWESEARRAASKGMRVVCARFGMILSPSGGALAQMLPPFQGGVGGRLGSGRQWMSWIALPDVVAALLHALEKSELQGPVVFSSPAPVRNEEFTRTLARVLRRPAVLPVPGIALRLLLGEMADQLLLCSQRTAPRALEASGFSFAHPQLEGALRTVLGRA